MFQYPQTDRRGCNNIPLLIIVSTLAVSVSTNGSKGVQPLAAASQSDGSVSFSIHKRIEGGATEYANWGELDIVSFSIHKRIEGGATFFPCETYFYSTDVSVSTNGSKGVQHDLQRLAALNHIVSVSTNGSKGVQPSSTQCFRKYEDSFSIHKRIEGGATYSGYVLSY